MLVSNTPILLVELSFQLLKRDCFLLGKLCYKNWLSKRRDKTPVLLSKFLWSIRNIIYNQFHNVACKRVLTKEKFQLFHLYGEMSSLRCQCLLSRVCAVMSRMYVVKNVNLHAQNKEGFFFHSFLFFFFFVFFSRTKNRGVMINFFMRLPENM